ncbi:MAG: c-type cytochrome [Rhodobacteraceae bacterium]|nr:c-type cytochrome [Paracoccaceae bacterium]
MSKSPNIFLPVLGATCIVLGAAYGLSTRTYKAQEAELAGIAAQAAQTRAEASEARVSTLLARLDDVQSKADQAIAIAGSAAGSAPDPAPDFSGGLGLGRAALPEELAAWDVDIMPDGRGLPVGRGDVLTGDELFAEYCASCHGDFAEGVDNWPVLAGGFDTLADVDPVKTVGSYWPYLSTVWDYVHRSMPFGAAQTLTDDEVYAIVAYILYSNDLVEEDFELSHETFSDVAMYNTEGFVVDDRAATEYTVWSAEPCMENCKDRVEITRRASMVNVTPVDDFMHPVMRGDISKQSAVEPSVPRAAQDAMADLVAAGEKVFKKCASCHQVGAGAKNRSGPQLNAVVGRTAGSVEQFRYSKVMAESGLVWDDTTLSGFLENPKGYLKGTKMSFRGLSKEEDRMAVIAYLRTISP